MKLYIQVGKTQIELNERVKSKYFFLASESELFVNRIKIGSIGGFGFDEKIEGQFKDEEGKEHFIEIEKGSSVFIYIDKVLVYSKTDATINILLALLGTSLVFILLTVIILIIILII